MRQETSQPQQLLSEAAAPASRTPRPRDVDGAHPSIEGVGRSGCLPQARQLAHAALHASPQLVRIVVVLPARRRRRQRAHAKQAAHKPQRPRHHLLHSAVGREGGVRQADTAAVAPGAQHVQQQPARHPQNIQRGCFPLEAVACRPSKPASCSGDLRGLSEVGGALVARIDKQLV